MTSRSAPFGSGFNFAFSRACLAFVGVLFVVQPTQGQEQPEVRILTVVDYISGDEVYLASGTEHGIHPGDTLPVYEGESEAAVRLGFFAVESATERRSVVTFSGARFDVRRADLLYLGLPKALADARLGPDPEETPDPEAVVSAEPATAAPASQTGPSRPPVQFNGRLYLDMDALRTTTRWGEGPGDETSRSFSTPTMRLQARARNLPGGMRLNTSMRLSHRSSPGDAIQPVTSVRFYQLDLEKHFETVPVQLNLGRFHNRYDDFAGYLDGAMVHLGDGGLGGGFAVGFEPDLWNESFSSNLPTVSGFLDYEKRGEENEYSGALSFRAVRPTVEIPDQTYVGLSQRIRLGDTWIRQRVQVQQRPGGTEWELARFQVDASVPLSGGLRAQAGWRSWRASTLYFSQGSSAPTRQRGNVGLSYWGLQGGATVDLSLDRPQGDEQARTVSSSFFLRRTPLLGLGFAGTASYWVRGDDTSLAISPEIRRDFGPAELRGAYHLYQTEGQFGTIRHESADLTLTLALGHGLSARVQGWVQWGEDLTGNRLHASLWKSF
jgi:hypothetical protein